MRVANIVPHSNVEQFPDAYTMALAHRLLRYPSEVRWFHALSYHGAHVILDNGVAEVYSEEEPEGIPFDKVLMLAQAIGAAEVCLPDVPYDKDGTLAGVHEWFNKVPWTQRMVVPQGKNPKEWLECLEALPTCKVIGINRALTKWGTSRHWGLEQLERLGLHEKSDVHLLGAWDDPSEELPSIASRFPWVRGVDTGIAAAYAQRGKKLSKWEGHFSLIHDRHAPKELLRINAAYLRSLAYGEGSVAKD